jgi:hypothetical protein
MQNLVRLMVAWVGLSVASHAIAAPVHTVTWTPQNVAPGTEVTIAGQRFVLVRVPVQNLGNTARYAVSFLAPIIQGALLATLTTQHSTDPIEDTIQIDGFAAAVTVSDGREYAIAPNFPNLDKYDFTVTAQAICVVLVKVGPTLLSFFTLFQTEQQASTDIGETPNAQPFAEWDAYVHPSAQVKGCDRWIDYIRIRQLD